MSRRYLCTLLSCLVCAGCALATSAQESASGETAAYDFALAKLLAEEGRPRQALQRMERAVRQLPEEPVLRIEYARLLLRAGQAERAVEEIDRARELAPENRDVLAAVAEIHLADGVRSAASFAAARSALEALSRLPDPDPRALISLAQIYLQQEEPARAARMLRDVDERLPGNRLVTAMLAEALIRGGEIEQAARHLETALERDPDDLQSRLTLAELQRQAGEFADEASTLAAASPTQREEDEVRRRLALALAQSGDVEAARGPLQELVEKRAATADDQLVYGRVLAALGENAEAERVLRSLLEDESLQAIAALELAPVLERLQRGDEAIELLGQAASALRRDGRADAAAEMAMERLGWLAARGSWPRIVQSLEGRLGALPETHRERGAQLLLAGLRESRRSDDALKLLRTGDLPVSEAVREAEEALTLWPTGREAEARRLLAQMEASGDRERLFEAGRAYLELEQFERAVPPFEKAAAARPGEASGLYSLAQVYYLAGRRDDSEEALRQVLGVAPDHPGALNDLGYLLAEDGRDLEEARRMTERAVLLQPDNGSFVDSLGWVCFRLGLLDEAQKYLERAVRLVPDEATVHEHLGDLYRERGDLAAAQRAYRRALEVGEEDSVAVERKLAALAKDS